MNDTELLAKFREQNRLRQSAFYEKNKEAVNARRRMKYKTLKSKNELAEEKEPELAFEPEPEPEPELQPEPQPEPPKEKMKPTRLNKNSLTYDKIVSKLKEIIPVQGTFNKYKNDIKRVMQITGCNDIIACLKKSKEIIDYINNSIKPNKEEIEPYAVNSKKSMYQSILVVIDKLKLKIDKEPYSNQFEIYKIKSDDEGKIKNKNIVYSVPSFQKYLEEVKNRFGEDSKMYLIARLYDELTIRDDYVLKIVSTEKQAVSDDINYLVVKKSNCVIVINTYKTEKHFGVIKHTCSPSLNLLIRKYIANNPPSNYLLGDKKLSSFLTRNNKYLNIKGGVNLLRQMKASEETKKIDENINKDMNAEEKKKLADSMRHSANSQSKYLRQIIKE
jgi:hypothetical protein